MEETHKHNTPVMRPLFFEFPEQETSWAITDQYCFGPDLLIAPVMHEGMRERDIWLPEGKHGRILRPVKAIQEGRRCITLRH